MCCLILGSGHLEWGESFVFLEDEAGLVLSFTYSSTPYLSYILICLNIKLESKIASSWDVVLFHRTWLNETVKCWSSRELRKFVILFSCCWCKVSRDILWLKTHFIMWFSLCRWCAHGCWEPRYMLGISWTRYKNRLLGASTSFLSLRGKRGFSATATMMEFDTNPRRGCQFHLQWWVGVLRSFSWSWVSSKLFVDMLLWFWRMELDNKGCMEWIGWNERTNFSFGTTSKIVSH